MSKTKKCFVIAPIGPDNSEIRARSDQIFEYVIQPAVAKYGYEAIRADQDARPGMITYQIIEHIIEDDLVIADLTGRNPNVYYELAIRHAFAKPCIQIKEGAETLPFDIEGMRTIDVDFRFVKSLDRCRDAIMGQIETIQQNSTKVQSPITFVTSMKSIGKDDAQAKINIEMLSQMQTIKSELESVKESIKPRSTGPTLQSGELLSFGNSYTFDEHKPIRFEPLASLKFEPLDIGSLLKEAKTEVEKKQKAKKE